MADVFNQQLWEEREELEVVNRTPFIPGLIGTLFNWIERGLRTTTWFFTSTDGLISLIPSSPRGGVPVMHRPTVRQARPVPIPHFAIADHINADEVQNVLSWRNPMALKTIEEERDQRVAEITPKLDLTVEHLRYGALQGLVTDANGVELANIYTLTGTTQEAEVNLDLGSVTAGVVYQKLVDLKRKVRRILRGDGALMTGLVILCDATLLDNFRKSKDYMERNSFDSRADALNEVTDSLTWLGVRFVEYEPGDFGPTGSAKFFGVGKGVAVPTGPGLNIFRTVYAPADYIDTVNQRALPRYMRSFIDPKNKFIEMEFQTNPLPFITRPEALIRVDDGVA